MRQIITRDRCLVDILNSIIMGVVVMAEAATMPPAAAALAAALAAAMAAALAAVRVN